MKSDWSLSDLIKDHWKWALGVVVAGSMGAGVLRATVNQLVNDFRETKKEVMIQHDFIVAQNEINKQMVGWMNQIDKKIDRLGRR